VATGAKRFEIVLVDEQLPIAQNLPVVIAVMALRCNRAASFAERVMS
jgi:hypothetical protein